MAKIVAAYGLPHTPFYPSQVIEEGPSSPTGKMFARARESLIAARPDVIVIFDTDHYNTFSSTTSQSWRSVSTSDSAARLTNRAAA
ncbi:MAG: hypothetical protein NTU64_10295 [Hyphomicrobiales bacterium]|nr:hypothetical protein [Hyphomicrobiales bacterium]